MSTIRYFIPEDGDKESHPNVFLAPKPRQAGYPPTLGQIKNAFPLPGRYHFRFKTSLSPGGDREKGGLAVWMDCVDDSQPVPQWRGTVTAKVTRIGVEEDDDDDDEDFRRPAGAATTTPMPAAQQPRQQQQQQQYQAPPAPAASTPVYDMFDGPSPQSGQHHHHHQPNFLDGPHSRIPHQQSGDSLLDMNFGQQQQQHEHNDFLSMATPSPPVSGNGYANHNNSYGNAHSNSSANNTFDGFF